MSNSKMIDKSNDRDYFVQIPQIVLALCRNPYDFTLWGVIKMISGEKGVCLLATPDLATLAMMSVGKVSDSRAYLLQVGLLEGSCYREPNYPQPVWHLTVPDIWLQNITWRQLYDGLKERVELKAKLRAIFEEADIYRRFDPDSFRQIDSLQDVNVKSLHNMKPSQNEGGVPQNEGGVPQNERKKNHTEPIEEPKKSPPPPAPPVSQKKPPKVRVPDSLAWQCFTEITSYYGVNKYWRGQMAEEVGESSEALERWKQIVIAWTGCGWFPGNVKGQLEYFRRGEIPSTGKSIQPTAAASPPKSPDYDQDLYQKLLKQDKR